MMNLPTVSGSEHFLRIPLTKIVGRLRLFSTPMMKLPTASGSEHFLCTPFTKVGGTPQARCTPMMKTADSFRLCAPPLHEIWGDVSGSVQPHGEHCRQSQALSTPPHGNWGTSQAGCTPMMKIADSLRLCAPPFARIGGRLRLCAPP